MKVKSESEVTQSCPTLRDPMDCSLPGSSVHGISQARVLEWAAIAFSHLSLVHANFCYFFSVYIEMVLYSISVTALISTYCSLIFKAYVS